VGKAHQFHSLSLTPVRGSFKRVLITVLFAFGWYKILSPLVPFRVNPSQTQ
jgi:hypothetical protein